MKFADTGWWVAWHLPKDKRHHRALAMAASVTAGEKILTTNLVIGESWTFLRAKSRYEYAIGFLDQLERLVEAGGLSIHRVSDQQETTAWEWLRRHDERVYSFVDATSFRVMTDRRLREALAFDSDFAAAGFVEVQP